MARGSIMVTVLPVMFRASRKKFLGSMAVLLWTAPVQCATCWMLGQRSFFTGAMLVAVPQPLAGASLFVASTPWSSEQGAHAARQLDRSTMRCAPT